MNANTLLAWVAAVVAAASASAQQLPRKPQSAFGSLRAGLPEPVPAPQPVVPVSASVIETGPPTFNSESAKMFAARVQPILANACAGCHARKDHAGRFKLRHVSGDFADPESATANLHAAARMVARDKPGDSPLLARATSAHGGAKEPPLRSRAVPAFRYLEVWVYWAASTEGAVVPDVLPTPAEPVTITRPLPTATPPSVAQLTGGVAKGVAEPPAAPSAGGVTHLSVGPAEPGKLPPLPKAEPVVPGGFASGPREAIVKPTGPNPDDEFDPTAFNRAMHPLRK